VLSFIARMADWCRKCIYLKPGPEKIAGEYPGSVFFVISICYPSDGFLGFRDMISRLCTVHVEPYIDLLI
jgi:hypothetical protein